MISLICLLGACSSGSGSGLFVEPISVAVDSANDRLFVLETRGQLFVLMASTRGNPIGLPNQPLVDDGHLTAVHDALPTTSTNMLAVTRGDGTRLFISGTQSNEDGELVQNRVVVIDFDGTTASLSDFSPIEIGTPDNATIGGLALDPDAARLYTTDALGGALHVHSVETGEEVIDPIDIAGRPNKMCLAGSQIYIANNADNETEQVIGVLHTDNDTFTTIDLDVPTNDLAALTTAAGTVLLAKHSTEQRVLIRLVDETGFNGAIEIATTSEGFEDGQLSAINGITSSIGGVILTRSTSETVFGYVPQADGIISLLTFTDDFDSFAAQNLASTAEVIEGGTVYQNEDGLGLTVYMAGRSSGDLVFTDVGSEGVSARFLLADTP